MLFIWFLYVLNVAESKSEIQNIPGRQGFGITWKNLLIEAFDSSAKLKNQSGQPHNHLIQYHVSLEPHNPLIKRTVFTLSITV